MKYSDVGHAFTEIMKIISMYYCKWTDSLVVTWGKQLGTDRTYLDRILEKKLFFVEMSNVDKIVLIIMRHLVIIFASFQLYLAAFICIHHSLGGYYIL